MTATRTALRLGATLILASAVSACAQGGGINIPTLGGPSAPQQPQVNAPAGPNDATLSGSIFLANGAYAPIPAGSRMTVRVYDSTRDVNNFVAEQVFTNPPAALPWRYSMGASLAAIQAMASPAVAARIEDPSGRLIYFNDTVAPLREGRSDDIAVIATPAAGVSTPQPPVYSSPSTQQPVYSAPTTTQPPVYQPSGDYDLVPSPLPAPTADDLIGADPIYQPAPPVYSDPIPQPPVYSDPIVQPPVYQAPTYETPVVSPSPI